MKLNIEVSDTKGKYPVRCYEIEVSSAGDLNKATILATGEVITL